MRTNQSLPLKIRNRNQRVKKVLNFLKVKAPEQYSKLVTKMPPSINPGLGAEDNGESSFWADFGKDLLETAVAVKAGTAVDKSEQRALELEISKINAESAAIERQIALQRTRNQATFTGGAKFILADLAKSPLTLAAIGLTGFLVVPRIMKKFRK